MVVLVKILPVVVTDHVQLVSIAGMVGQLGEAQSAGDGPGVVQPVDDFRQFFGDRGQPTRVGLAGVIKPFGSRLVGVVVAQGFLEQGRHVGIVGVVDLVADAPQDHAGMVPVPQHHGGQVALVPFGEVLGIAEMLGRVHVVPLPPFVFRALPFVKGFVHHQEPQLVAQIQQIGIGRIVGGADGVAACVLEFEQPALPHVLRHRRAEAPSVMVDAEALDFHGFSVQEEALVGVEPEGADTHGNFFAVGRPTLGQRFPHQCIQIRMVDIPQLCIGNGHVHAAGFLLGGNGSHFFSLRVQETERDPLRTDGFIGDAQASGCPVRGKRFDKYSMLGKTDGFADRQRYMPVDAAAGIPTGIRHVIVFHPHGDHVFPCLHEGRNVEGKAGVAIGVVSQIITVDPDLRVLVHALEGEAHALAPGAFIQRKVLAIPGRTPGQIARAAGMGWVEGMLHRPVVGQRHPTPRPVVIPHEARVRRVAQVETPVQVHVHFDAHSFPPIDACSAG